MGDQKRLPWAKKRLITGGLELTTPEITGGVEMATLGLRGQITWRIRNGYTLGLKRTDNWRPGNGYPGLTRSDN